MGTDTGYVKVAADPEQVDGTILDGRDYSSGQLPQENIRIIKEADATLRLNLGTRPIGTFVVLITVARPCGSRRVGLSFLSRGK